MTEDPIVEEVRRAGAAYFQRFNNDIKAVMEDLRRRSEQAGRTVVSRPPRLAKPRPARSRQAG
jgi:hypothetical protein